MDKYRKRFTANAEEFDAIMAEMLAEMEQLRSALQELTGHNTPTSYESDDDEIGGCAYCRGLNLRHEADCPTAKAEKLLEESK